MKAVEVWQPRGPLQLVERDVPSPAMGYVLIKVQACGIDLKLMKAVVTVDGKGYPHN